MFVSFSSVDVMPVMPRSAQLARRETQHQAQRERVEEMTAQQRFMYQQQQIMQQQARMQQQQMQQQRGMVRPTSTYDERKAMRRKNILTSQDEAAMESDNESGRGFRLFFLGLVVAVLLGLMFLKVDAEVGIELPEAAKRLTDKAQGIADVQQTAPISKEDQRLIDEFNSLLDGSKAAKVAAPAADDESHGQETPEQAMKRKRRERNKLRKAVDEAFQVHVEERGSLVACGRSCEAKHQQLQLARDKIMTEIDRELTSVLAPDEDVAEDLRERGRFLSPGDVEKMFTEKKKKIEAQPVSPGSVEEEDKQLELAELQEARDIFISPKSRQYYQLTGRKPPEMLRKANLATHGGWGQELLLRTHYHKLILTWMKFFDNSRVDLGVIVFVFVCLFLGPALAKLPQTIAMAQRMTEEWEQMAELERRAKQR